LNVLMRKFKQERIYCVMHGATLDRFDTAIAELQDRFDRLAGVPSLIR
jgi:hypothetical protein